MTNKYDEYFEYLDMMIDSSTRISEIDRKEYKLSLSLFKVSGYYRIPDSYEPLVVENLSFDTRLYILFEHLSRKIFKIKPYNNWLDTCYNGNI